MARAFYSPIFDYIRGKFGNAVFSANTAGEYMKDYVIPANPNTVSQVNIRAIFSAVASVWNTLSVANRSLWDVWANSGYSPLDRSVNTLRYTGRQAYSALSIAVTWFLDWYNTDHAISTDAWTVGSDPSTESFLTPAVVSSPPTNLTGSKQLLLSGTLHDITSFVVSTNSTTHRKITVTFTNAISAATYTDDLPKIGGEKGSFGVYLSKQVPVDGYKVSQKFVTKWFQAKPIDKLTTTVSAPATTLTVDLTGTFVATTGKYYATLVWLTKDGQQIDLVSSYVTMP
jgi:hypothetical protein